MADVLFRKISALGQATIRRAYGALAGTERGGWQDAMTAHAITPLPHLKLANGKVNGKANGKNGADIALVIDAMEYLQRKCVEGFCIVSSDSDFSRLAERVREHGLIAYGFGDHRIKPEARQFFSEFFDLSPTSADATRARVLQIYKDLAKGESRVHMSQFAQALKAAESPVQYEPPLHKFLDDLGSFKRDGHYVSLKADMAA